MASAQVRVLDVGVATGFQDVFHGHFNRGRSLVAADFDNDGDNDFFVGNPGDVSFILRNDQLPNGRFRMENHEILLDGAFAWGAAASDYDNDGDIDLFIAAGGNECAGFDVLFQNQFIETGEMTFVDVTDIAGVAAPSLPGFPGVETGSGNAMWGDVDQDGDTDLFVNGNADFGCANVPDDLHRNTLWLNDGDGTFTDVTVDVALHTSLKASRHSTFFDYDGDSDLDLYETNWLGENILWRNRLIEDGELGFEDVTAEMSAPDNDLAYPLVSFVSCATDFNNDGFEDLMVFARGDNDHPDLDCSAMHPTGPMNMFGDLGPYDNGHAIFMNGGGTSFDNIAATTGLNDNFTSTRGVMGSQLGDVNGDGIADLYIGNGGPAAGQHDQLYLSVAGSDSLTYEDRSDLIDFAPPRFPNAPPGAYPDYPYRTHGTTIVDVDGDHRPEIMVNNGGPVALPDFVREPNRAFKFLWDVPFSFMKVRLVGDGVDVSRDAIGSRVRVTVSANGGDTWDVYQTLNGGNCFSAQNGFDLLFGLQNADTVHEMEIRWADGSVEMITEGLEIDSVMTIEK